MGWRVYTHEQVTVLLSQRIGMLNQSINVISRKKYNQSNYDKGALKQMLWFDAVVAGKIHTDFFASRVTNYSKGHMDWDNAF